MPGTYAPGDYDLAGFIVGVVDTEQALTGAGVRDGRRAARPALGRPAHERLHAWRARCSSTALGLARGHAPARAGHDAWAQALLAPHRGYLAALEPLLERGKIRALAHITGGGFPGNIPRVLPAGLGARIRTAAWAVPPLFRLIQRGGAVSDDEMFRTFNMGIGMVVVVAPGDLHEVEHSLERRGETSFVIGTVVGRRGRRPRVSAASDSRVGVLISGRGSQPAGPARRRRARASWAARVAVVISNVADAPGPGARAPRRACPPSSTTIAAGRARSTTARCSRDLARRTASTSSAWPATCGCSPPSFLRGLSRPRPERPSLAAARLSRARRPAPGLGARRQGQRRHRAPGGRRASTRGRSCCRRRCRCCDDDTPEAWPRASWRPSIASTRAPCGCVLEGRCRVEGRRVVVEEP